ncbi:cytidyltransferase-like domain-containing protein [Allopseudospirillum japonicum]|uniref:Cytidyltransferase-like domain-containing protein n=1 Tax=Allopseudospirillum japonicum TaxID=64971 RepID=A0A1H6UM41_9GAMM|nr:adenylyltransferase/cytidyltransferase family protein [Allopseudospirillum japonicum]SEI93369.1 cytidyltransferase-like domain-containing protein [Allopseudospirillum japonicum]
MPQDKGKQTSTFTVSLQEAQQAFARGQYAAAEQAFQNLHKQDPSVKTTLYLAQLAHIRQAGAEWIAPLKRILQAHPALAEAHYLLAHSYQQNRQLPQAVQSFYQALSWRLQQVLAAGQTALPMLEASSPAPNLPTQALTLLLQTLVSLKKAGIHAFPTAGTLLGLERTGQLLAQDKDIDIGVDWAQMDVSMQHLQQIGWQEESLSYGLINPRCLRHPSGLVLDLCGYATEQTTGATVSGLWMPEVPFAWNRITRFPKIQVVNKASPVGDFWYPRHPEHLLQALYGPDWQTPDPDFDTIVCAPNIMQDSYLYYCQAYARLYHGLQQGRYKKMQAMLHVLMRFKPEDILLQNLLHFVQQQLGGSKARRVLALGYFDLLHPGHISYLTSAKAQGDYLIVGVAPDSFAIKSKGRTPVMNQQERLSLVQALACVDQAVLVGAPMAETEQAAHWICAQGVHLVVCGDEWQHTPRWQALEAALQPQGIQVQYVPYTQGISSTQIKQRILPT